MSVTRRLRLYGWTLANMDHRQLVGVVERAGRNHLLPRLPVDIDARYEADPPPTDALRTGAVVENLAVLRASLSPETVTRARELAGEAADGTVTFMNSTVEVGADPVDWDHPELAELPRLWRLKLHGFEPLGWLVTSMDADDPEARACAETFEIWIDDWLDTHPVGEEGYLRRGWTPYAVSKRVVNLARFCAWQADAGLAPSAGARAGLRKNASFLADNVEHDVGGNHVIENGVALVAAGTVLPDGESIRDTGLAVLADPAGEQFLGDGGHYERSPMYHLQVLTGYLTALDLCTRSGLAPPEPISDTVREGMSFLAALTPPDGRIPLLNDAVFGETLSLAAVRAYASRIDGTGWSDGTPDRIESPRAALPDTGYYWLGDGDDRMLVDGGPVGPPHLPGHSHNDLLSVLLWVDGQRVVADSGTYSYQPGERRQYARGVRAHSTVRVGDREPIELGRRFLMGERTEPQTAFRRGPVDAFRGSYTAHCGYEHTRCVHGADDWWLVWDRVTDAGTNPVVSQVLLHPTVGADSGGEGEITVTDSDGEPIAWVYPLRVAGTDQSDGKYFPQFGVEQPRTVLELRPTDAGGGFGYVVSTTPRTTVDVTVANNSPESLTLGQETVQVPTV